MNVIVAPFDCAQFDQDCESCTAADPCGYCASSGDCKLGAKSGPANSTCPAGEIDWIFEGEHCSLAFNCTPFGEDCETCTSNEACGYCTATGSCYNGNILGPVFNASLCAHDFWAYTTEECPGTTSFPYHVAHSHTHYSHFPSLFLPPLLSSSHPPLCAIHLLQAVRA